MWFEWSRSLEDPAEYVLVEPFRDGGAGGVHVNSVQLQAGDAGASAGAEGHAQDHQSDDRRDRLVGNGGDVRRLGVMSRELFCRVER